MYSESEKDKNNIFLKEKTNPEPSVSNVPLENYMTVEDVMKK
jgi:hypothetical protein